ncbi:protein PLASTID TRANSCRIPTIONALLY ACTIVE 12 isoform X2 [Amborella trichopoda]|uniref:protein PLASTID TRANSCRIPTIONALLY ACTIVE 12 isoform X2 n=1 Tax=Amborella trichopoda TaxID=13333 RepID=UPI0005D2F281|nr:protein PLASTID TRANSCRIPTIONALLY ACTIVE 12 isoform X2 [Amborella trichopoda]XP_020518643.1 protein PLASTID TRANSCRIPTIONALLY ACTIVE 12 isoform X2 [Amborella trichopoda]|eukprot:XP_011620768.1 protein PLASTID TRANSCRIPTIONALLY ACTIVE 12 isoform X2 [Amborella trichopoda]
MASLFGPWSHSIHCHADKSNVKGSCLRCFQGITRTIFLGSFPTNKRLQSTVWLSYESSERNIKLLPCVKCSKKDDKPVKRIFVEPPPYYSYMDSTSGQMEPASGARASIPGPEYWPEGTASRVRAARAPAPTGNSKGKPSYGKNPGSRRRKSRTKELSASSNNSSIVENGPSNSLEENVELDMLATETVENLSEEPKDTSDEYVIYQTEPEKENISPYELDKRIGRPHSFIDPEKKRPIEDIRTSEELWWNWRKPENEQWSRWQRRRPDVDTVFSKAMAETGQIKLYGEHPTLAETSLARARRHIFKEERLKAEQERLEKIGPIAYYSEWVKAWKRDTSREAVQKHYEETGEDENTQLIEMFCHQTAAEFRIMMGRDVRIQRDPLAMRMREDQIKQIWGGDPVYPTINYIQDPNEVTDFRGPEFHEPTPDILAYLMEHGKMISREELEKILAKEKTQQLEQITDMDEAMAQAVDIGENDDDDEEDGSEAEGEDELEEKITRNWSVLKSTPELNNSKKKKPKKDSMTLEEAIDDSENLTDFLMDFSEDEE